VLRHDHDLCLQLTTFLTLYGCPFAGVNMTGKCL